MRGPSPTDGPSRGPSRGETGCGAWRCDGTATAVFRVCNFRRWVEPEQLPLVKVRAGAQSREASGTPFEPPTGAFRIGVAELPRLYHRWQGLPKYSLSEFCRHPDSQALNHSGGVGVLAIGKEMLQRREELHRHRRQDTACPEQRTGTPAGRMGNHQIPRPSPQQFPHIALAICGVKLGPLSRAQGRSETALMAPLNKSVPDNASPERSNGYKDFQCTRTLRQLLEASTSSATNGVAALSGYLSWQNPAAGLDCSRASASGNVAGFWLETGHGQHSTWRGACALAYATAIYAHDDGRATGRVTRAVSRIQARRDICAGTMLIRHIVDRAKSHGPDAIPDGRHACEMSDQKPFSGLVIRN